MKKGTWRRLLIGGAVGLTLLVVILLAAVLFIAITDRREVPRLVEKKLEEASGAHISFSHYHFSLFRSFPFLTLVLEDVAVRDPGYETYRRELLRIGELGVQFRFWKLFRREFEVRSVSLDGGEVNLFKNSSGTYANTDFLRRDSTRATPPRGERQPAFSIDHVRLRNFSFRLVDSLRLKDFHIELRDTRVDLGEMDLTGQIRLRGDWFFHGLTFKFQNGPFLRDKEAVVDWQLIWDKQEKKIDIGPSTLAVDGETYALSGYLTMGQTPYLKLVIDHPGILLEAGREIVADNIRNSLNKFSIDRPVKVKVVVEGALIPGHPAPADVFFAVQDAGVQVNKTHLTQTSFSGRFFNCDPGGPVDPHSGCLEIDHFSGRLLGVIPIHLRARLEDLADPFLQVEGGIKTSLPELAPALPPGMADLQQGQFDLAFQLAGRMAGASGQGLRLDGGLDLKGAALRYLPTGLTVTGLNIAMVFEEGDLVIRNFQADLGQTPVNLHGRVHNLLPFIFSPGRQLQAALEVRTGVLDVDSLLPPAQSKAKPEKRPAGGNNDIAATIQTLLDRVNAELNIFAEGLRVRGYSASDVTLKSRFLSYCPEGGADGCLFLDTLDAKIYGNLPFGASLRITDLDDPYLRLRLQLSGPLTSFNDLLPADQVQLHSGELDLKLRFAGLLDDYFNPGQDKDSFDFEGWVKVRDASADYQAGKYLLRGVEAEIEFDEDHLRLPSAALELNGNAVELQGAVDDFIPFLFTEAGALNAGLVVRSPELDFNAFPIGKDQKKTKREGDRKAPGSSLIARKLASVAEHLEAELSVQAGRVIFHEFNAEEVSIHGLYSLTFTPGQPPAGCVEIDSFSARLFGNAPLRASFVVEDLNDPLFTVDARVNMPLEDLNAMFPPDQMQFHGGTVDVQLRYRGQPHNHFDAENALVKAELDGEVVFSDAAFDYVSKGYRFGGIRGRIEFDQQDVILSRLELTLNDNSLTAGGRFHHLIPFLFSPSRALEVALEVNAPEISLDRFSAPAKHQGKSRERKHQATPVTRSVNAALDSLNVDFKLAIGQLHYRNFTGRDLFAELHLDRRELRIREARMQAGNGQFRLEGAVTGLENNRPQVDVEARFRETDISGLFQSFDNFGLEGFSHQNIKGILDADLSFRAQANENYDLDPQSMEGYFLLKVKDGELIDFPMMASLQNFLVKNRNLDDIRFGRLEKIFRLEDQLLRIEKFALASSVVSFKVDGTYDLLKSGKTDLLFEIPLANLFEGDTSQEALDRYFERKHGPSMLLRMTPKKDVGTLHVQPVLSRKKHRKSVD